MQPQEDVVALPSPSQPCRPSNNLEAADATVAPKGMMLPAGSVVGQWTIRSFIGSGAFGETYGATDHSAEFRGKEVCIKVEKTNKPLLRAELVYLRRVEGCPHVVSCYGGGQVMVGGHPFSTW